MAEPAANVEDEPGKDEHSHAQPNPPVCKAKLHSEMRSHKCSMLRHLPADSVQPLCKALSKHVFILMQHIHVVDYQPGLRMQELQR